jgi:ligand-binding sensor domain-containing protein
MTATVSAVATVVTLGQQHAFVHYTTRDGLSQSQVRCMVQDERGYLWFGTLGGLSRFDGAVFTNYALQEGLPDAQVNALWSDDDGLWVGAGDHLVHFSGRDLTGVDLPGDVNARVMAVVGAEKNERFIATDGAGVFRAIRGQVVPLPGYPQDSAASARALLCQDDGTLWIGLRNGLLKWKNGSCTAVPLGDARSKSVSALSIAPDGTLWVGTFGDGLFEVRNDSSVRNITEEEGLLQNNVRCLLTDERGRTWIGTKFGLNVLDGQRIRAFTVHQGMPNDNIWCAMMDREGQLWFGTDGSGVLRYTGDRFVTFTATDGLCSDQVMNITADATGDLWLGTYGNGICRMDAMAMVTTLDGLPNNTIWCGLLDRQGRMWFGTSGGLSRIENGRVVLPAGDQALSDQRVLSLFEAADGTIWCGTREGLSSIGIDGRLTTRGAGDHGPGRSIRSIAQDERGRLWLATDEGISMFDGKDFERYTTAEGLADNAVFCLLLDARSRIWAGTANGLSCLADGRFQTVRLGQDFGSNYIDLLIGSSDGRLWAGTNNGLFAFDPDSLLKDASRAEHFNLADGLRDLEFNLNAAFRDPDGRLFFGTPEVCCCTTPPGARGSLLRRLLPSTSMTCALSCV